MHYCQAKGEHVVRDYRDSTSLSIGIEAGAFTGAPGRAVCIWYHTRLLPICASLCLV